MSAAAANSPVNRQVEKASVLWVKRILIFVVAGGAVAAAGSLMSGVVSTPESGTQLTHKIRRDNLRVSVTEQGLWRVPATPNQVQGERRQHGSMGD